MTVYENPKRNKEDPDKLFMLIYYGFISGITFKGYTEGIFCKMSITQKGKDYLTQHASRWERHSS
jgi:hypothetical protein